jgi:putative ABC transport system permease protein
MPREFWDDLRYRMRAFFRRKDMERELEQELQFHLEQAADKLIARGVAPDEAMRRARAEFGGVERVKEESREGRGLSFVDSRMQDVRYAARALRRNPGFTLGVVITLGLGIGANSSMFAVVDRLMFRPPSLMRDADRVHRVYLVETRDGKVRTQSSLQYTRFLDLTRWTTSFSTTAAFAFRSLAVGTGQEAAEMMVGAVSATYFTLFDAPPALGRYFSTAEDTVPRGAAVAVVSHAFWKQRYGGDRAVIGKTLHVGPVLCTIIGVAPAGMTGMDEGQVPVVYMPITTYASTVDFLRNPTDYYTNYNWDWLEMLALRKPGVTPEAATADLSNAALRSYEVERAANPNYPPPDQVHPRALAGNVLSQRGPQQSAVGKLVIWLGGVAAIVLLIACANVMNLLLARAVGRRREIAMRLALGVSRARLFSQLFTESFLLSLVGGGVGLLVAHVTGGMLRSLFLPDVKNAESIVDARMVGFAAVAALGAGLLTGLAPILQARRSDLAGTLKAGTREGVYQSSRLRSALLIFQGALSVVLLIGAGLFVRSLQNVRAVPLGYDVQPVLLVEPMMRGVKLTRDQRAALARQLHETAKTIPGVAASARGVTVPFYSNWSENLTVPGVDSVKRLGNFTLQSASPDYFQTVGTRVLRGRGLAESDRAGAPLVVLVSQHMADVLWPGRDALGQCIKMGTDTMPCRTVVGITENIKQRNLNDDSGLHYFLPVEQFHPEEALLFVRVRGEAKGQVETLRRRLQQLMPGTSYVTVVTMQDIVDPKMRSWKVGATLFAALGGLALLLAAIGLYSVVAYDVAQRKHELGVRIALGAQASHLLRLVVGEGVRFAVIGILIGGALALWAGRYATPLLYAESPRDPLVFGVVTGVLLSVAVLASAHPALRASRVDPNVVLREE